jgi:hypothetical protein
VDEQRALSHAGDAARLVPDAARHATTVVVDGQHHHAGGMGQLDAHALGLCVAGDVG